MSGKSQESGHLDGNPGKFSSTFFPFFSLRFGLDQVLSVSHVQVVSITNVDNFFSLCGVSWLSRQSISHKNHAFCDLDTDPATRMSLLPTTFVLLQLDPFLSLIMT